MLLEASSASTVLTWVRPDLDKHLDQIRNQIEHVSSSTHSGDGIDNILTNLSTLKYTFKALVLQGATLVVEEMIVACTKLKAREPGESQETFASLMDAIVVLPSYLDRLQAGHHDLPVLLLPVINDLRTAYNANIVSEAALFSPDLDIPLPELEQGTPENEAVFDESRQVFFMRMRRQWETALLQWLQEQDDTERLSPLHGVCNTLQRRVERIDLRRLWWIASEVIGGLLDGVTDNDVNLRRLFARLNLILKNLTEGGEEKTETGSVDAISQALLFHIAQAKPGSSSVDKLKERFQLQELIPDRDVLIRARGAVSGRNRELYISLGAAIRDELALIKDALDLELRTGEAPLDGREIIQEALLRLKDTLKMMGLGDSALSIENLMPAFNASDSPDQDTEHPDRKSLLMDLASKLLQVESVLEEQITTLGEPLKEDQASSYIDLPGHEQRRIRSHLFDETINSLHQLQDGVHLRLNGDQQADYSSPVEHIAGALELIGESETASLVLKLRNALGNLLKVTRAESVLDRKKLETLADAVAALELYLAGCRDQQGNRERFLAILQERLEQLPVGEVSSVETFDTPPTQDALVPRETTATQSPDASLPLAPDPELLEVFLEEFESVVKMLAEQLPQWIQNQEDTARLVDIRRGFHTLKGSGRMVGANEIGEFAWHIEDMLNTSLEGNVGSLDDVALTVSLAEAMLPDMKNRLLQLPAELSGAAIDAISQLADSIRGGHLPDWVSAGDSLPLSLNCLLSENIADIQQSEHEPLVRREEPDESAAPDPTVKQLRDSLFTLKGLMEKISRERSETASEEEILAVQAIAVSTARNPQGRESDIAAALHKFLATQRHGGKYFNDTTIWVVATSLAYFETCLALHNGDPDAELMSDEDSHINQLKELTLEFEIEDRLKTKSTETVTKDESVEKIAATSDDRPIKPSGPDEEVETDVPSRKSQPDSNRYR